MSTKNNKQFGVWMDAHHATVVGMPSEDSTAFGVLAHYKNTAPTGNSNEHTGHNAEQGLQLKFFKEITASMQNATNIHVTGTGTAQEQFIRFLEATAQFKNITATKSTTSKMSDEQLAAYINEQY